MLGNIALFGLLTGYSLLLFGKEKLFLLVNSFASFLFAIYGYEISSYSVLLANAFIGSILFGTFLKKLKKN